MLHIYIILLSKNLWFCLNRSVNTQKFTILLCRQSIKSLFLTCIIDACLGQVYFHNEILQRVTITIASGSSWLHFTTSPSGETYEDQFSRFWKWLSWRLFFLADDFFFVLKLPHKCKTENMFSEETNIYFSFPRQQLKWLQTEPEDIQSQYEGWILNWVCINRIYGSSQSPPKIIFFQEKNIYKNKL